MSFRLPLFGSSCAFCVCGFLLPPLFLGQESRKLQVNHKHALWLGMRPAEAYTICQEGKAQTTWPQGSRSPSHLPAPISPHSPEPPFQRELYLVPKREHPTPLGPQPLGVQVALPLPEWSPFLREDSLFSPQTWILAHRSFPSMGSQPSQLSPREKVVEKQWT